MTANSFFYKPMRQYNEFEKAIICITITGCSHWPSVHAVLNIIIGTCSVGVQVFPSNIVSWCIPI